MQRSGGGNGVRAVPRCPLRNRLPEPIIALHPLVRSDRVTPDGNDDDDRRTVRRRAAGPRAFLSPTPRHRGGAGVIACDAAVAVGGAHVRARPSCCMRCTRTGSPVLAGWLAFAAVAPGLAISPIAGALIDRVGSIWAITVDMVASAACVAALIALDRLGWASAPVLLALIGLFSLTSPLTMAGIRALLPRLVPVTALDRANALDTATARTDGHRRPGARPALSSASPGRCRRWAPSPSTYAAAALCVGRIRRPRGRLPRLRPSAGAGVERRAARRAAAHAARTGRGLFVLRGVLGHPGRGRAGVRGAAFRRRHGRHGRRPALGRSRPGRRHCRTDRRPSAHRGPRAAGDGARHAGDRHRGMAACARNSA